MNPSFDKNGLLLMPEQLTNITRSFSFKLGLSGYSSVDFFASRSGQCPISQAQETSRSLYEFCYAEVVEAVQEYKRGMQQLAEDTLRPPEPTPATKPVEANPFRVSAAPSPSAEPAKESPFRVAPELQSADPTKVVVVNDTGEVKIVPIETAPASEGSEQKIQPVQPDPDLEKAKDLLAEVTGRNLATSPTPPEPPKRRGRPRGANGKSGTDAKGNFDPPAEQPAQDASPAGSAEVKSPDQPPSPSAVSGFKAGDDDLPANMGGTHVVEPGPNAGERVKEFIQNNDQRIPPEGPPPEPVKSSGPQLVQSQPGQLERIKAAGAAIAAETKKDPELVHGKVKEFMRAFLNIKGPLPKPPDDVYKFAIPILESLAKNYAGHMVTNPDKLGTEAGAGWGKFVRHIDKWPEALKHAAMRAAIHKYPDNAMDLLDFLQDVAKLGALDNELLVFLKVFRQVGPAAAMALKQCSTDRGRNMAEIVEGIDLDAITEKDVLSRVAGGSPPSAAPAGQTGELWQE